MDRRPRLLARHGERTQPGNGKRRRRRQHYGEADKQCSHDIVPVILPFKLRGSLLGSVCPDFVRLCTEMILNIDIDAGACTRGEDPQMPQ